MLSVTREIVRLSLLKQGKHNSAHHGNDVPMKRAAPFQQLPEIV